jgi:hypothetical protein
MKEFLFIIVFLFMGICLVEKREFESSLKTHPFKIVESESFILNCNKGRIDVSRYVLELSKKSSRLDSTLARVSNNEIASCHIN